MAKRKYDQQLKDNWLSRRGIDKRIIKRAYRN